MSDNPYSRQIRSFVRREGRLTKAQAQAIDQLWPQYGLDLTQEPPNFSIIFGQEAPLVLEIGFGNGRGLIEMAKQYPQYNFLGVEVYRPGIGALLQDLAQTALPNVRVYCADAVEVLKQHIPDLALRRLQIFFPDPWPKLRHHKRRLIQSSFIRLAWQKLAVGGVIHLATDWEDYAQQMLVVLSSQSDLRNLADENAFYQGPRLRPSSKFEARGQHLGHDVWDLLFEKTSHHIVIETVA